MNHSVPHFTITQELSKNFHVAMEARRLLKTLQVANMDTKACSHSYDYELIYTCSTHKAVIYISSQAIRGCAVHFSYTCTID